MHPENDESRSESGATQRPGRPGRRGILLGAAAVLALTGTVLGVATAGMSAGNGAVTSGAGRPGTGMRGISGMSELGPGAPGAGGQTGGGGRATRQSAGHQNAGRQSAGRQNAGRPSAGRQSAGRQSAGRQSAGRQSAGRQSAGHQSAAGAGASAGALRTSCRNVAHIGDSTSVDLISAAFLPDPAQRLAARYRDVGVTHLRIDASGGRSIVEELPGQRNGYTVASGWRNHGYHGCWVFALGTNDAANVAAGSTVGLTARIDQMMAVAHGQPVLWVNTRTELSSGPWSETNERAWDTALTKALARYPNMRIFNWAAVAKPGWFLPDGIHYNTAGCAARARAIANALARAFPARGRSKGKVVL